MKKLNIAFLLSLLSIVAVAQTGPVLTADGKLRVTDSIVIEVKKLANFHRLIVRDEPNYKRGGITAQMNTQAGRVSLTMSVMKPYKMSRVTPYESPNQMIPFYSIYSDESGTDIVKPQTSYTVKSKDWYLSHTYQSDDISYLVQGLDIYNKSCALQDAPTLPGSTFFNPRYDTLTNNLIRKALGILPSIGSCFSAYMARREVVIKIHAKNVTIEKIQLPMIGEVRASELMQLYAQGDGKTIRIYINDELRSIYNPNNNGIAFPNQIAAYIGDEITIKVPAVTNDPPTLNSGLAYTWIARFAGNVYFYCSPTPKPGGYKPWVGLDSRVHNVVIRPYPHNYDLRHPNWVKENGYWVLSWTLQRERRVSVQKYEPSYVWPLYRRIKKPITGADKKTKYYYQRYSQKEGLNMQFLNYWKNFKQSNFDNYSDPKNKTASYMLGFDDDELLYVNTQKKNAPEANAKIFKLEHLLWKEFPEDTLIQYDSNGYQISGSSLNWMVTAYQRSWLKSYYPNTYVYNGYEIQDRGTSQEHPSSPPNSKNQLDIGNLSLSMKNGTEWNIPINVFNPVSNDGFYFISGNKWPSYGQINVKYTILSKRQMVTYRNVSEKNIIVEYQVEDRQGRLRVVKSAHPTVEDGNYVFNIDSIINAGYANLAVYYQRNPNSERVLIGGTQLRQIFNLFTGIKELNGKPLEGKGHGFLMWLEDLRKKKEAPYLAPKRFGPRTLWHREFLRAYTISPNDKVKFTSYDGDPHQYLVNETDWYSGSKLLANRLPVNRVHSLKYTLDRISPETGKTQKRIISEHSGQDWEYTFNIPGTYRLTAGYYASEVTHIINVVDYPDDIHLFGEFYRNAVGRIATRDLTPTEMRLLGIPRNSGLKVMEVKDMYSQYVYKEGPRWNNPPDRWARDNDFLSDFLWVKEKVNAKSQFTIISQPAKIKEWIRNYSHSSWYWKNWAYHYSSNWRNDPVEGHPGLDGLPPDVPNDKVIRLYDEQTDMSPYDDVLREAFFRTEQPAKWQSVIPLLSPTIADGVRMRTNPSCIYDLEAIFDKSNGAFSGNPKLPSLHKTQAPDISDDDKEKQNLYKRLSNKRMLIYHPENVKADEVKVFNLVPQSAANTVFNISGGGPLNIHTSFGDVRTVHFIASSSFKPPPKKPKTEVTSLGMSNSLSKIIAGVVVPVALVGGGSFAGYKIYKKVIKKGARSIERGARRAANEEEESLLKDRAEYNKRANRVKLKPKCD